MKVWQLINKISNSTRNEGQLFDCFVLNDIQPYDLIENYGNFRYSKAVNDLNLNKEIPAELLALIQEKYFYYIEQDELEKFLEEEIKI
jgi:hypothetical protein